MTTTDDLKIEWECIPFDDAIARLRSTKRLVHLHVGTFAQFTIQNPAHPERTLGTVGCGTIPLSKKRAVEFLLDAFPEHHRRKLCLRVAISKRCIFFGSSPR